MNEKRYGQVVGVNGNMVAVAFEDRVMQNEVSYVIAGEEKLKAEVIRVRGKRADLQVYEDTQGIRIGDQVEFSNELLSVELGPGLISQVYDGLQNPLYELAKQFGFFLKRGAYLTALPEDHEWEFTPTVKKGSQVLSGEQLGTVPEKLFKHWIMVPFHLKGQLEVVDIVPQGKYSLAKTIAHLKNDQGVEYPVTMKQVWPVKVPITAYQKKIKPQNPLITKIRLIDSLVPVALGGTFCTPGAFWGRENRIATFIKPPCRS